MPTTIEFGTESTQSIDALAGQVNMSNELINSAPGIFYLVNRQGYFVRVNPYFLKVTGYTEEEIKCLSLHDIFHPTDKEIIAQQMQKAFETGESLFETDLVTKSGDTFPYSFRGHCTHFGLVDYLVGLGTDITKRKAMEASIRQQLLFSNALNRISTALVEQDSQTSIFEDVAKIIGEVLEADRIIFYEISFEKQQVIGINEWLNFASPDVTSSMGNYPLATFSGGIDCLLQTKSYFTSHRDNVHPALIADGSDRVLHDKKKIQSLLWYPFTYIKSGFFALVLNQTRFHRDWADEEIAFIESVSHLTSIALEKIWALEERKQTANEISIAATVFQAQDGMMVTDADNTILRVNKAFTDITGYTAEEAIGNTPRLLRSGRHDTSFYAVMWEEITQHGFWEGEIWNRRKSGEIFPERITISAVKNQSGELTNYVAMITDITESKKAADQIKHLAFYDPLTQLPNRRLLRDRLTQALLTNERSGQTGAVLFIDLDNFKQINDTLGHMIGDLMLEEAALRLKACVRDGDTVARFGGDEFIILLKDLSKNSVEAATQAEIVGKKVLSNLNQPYFLDQKEFHNTTSIGITLFTGNIHAADELLRQADIAMYEAKDSGRNTLRFFDPQMQQAVDVRSALEIELHKGLDQQQFELYFQVQMDYLHYPIGAEALIRWNHPDRGLVSPAMFIPVAEKTGLIMPIGHWVMEAACRQLKAWEKNSQTRDLVLSINVSAHQFRKDDFVAQVQEMIGRHAINAHLLKFELTESLFLDNIEGVIRKMEALKELGIRFSLDDFGTGYSSLQYLKRLPLQQLKIDQSFVRDLVVDSSDKAIVDTIISMAHSLHLGVIAEGVETEEQRLYLENAGCPSYQGYLFSKPVPIDEFDALINQLDLHNRTNSANSTNSKTNQSKVDDIHSDDGCHDEVLEIFVWNESFLTGIPEIDEQHRRLVNLINELASGIAAKTGPIELEKFFNRMTDYASYHFRTEEQIWHQYLGDESLEESHNRVVESFIAEVLRLKNLEHSVMKEDVMENVLNFLTNWLAFHILDSDKRLAMVVQALKSGMPLEKARQHVIRESSGALKVLIAANMTMYKQLSKRTLQLLKEMNERKLTEQRFQELLERTSTRKSESRLQDEMSPNCAK